MCEPKPGERCAHDTRSRAAARAGAYATAHPQGPRVDPLVHAEQRMASFGAAATDTVRTRIANLRSALVDIGVPIDSDKSDPMSVLANVGGREVFITAVPSYLPEYRVREAGELTSVSCRDTSDVIEHLHERQSRPLQYAEVGTLVDPAVFATIDDAGACTAYEVPAGTPVLAPSGYRTGIPRPNDHGGGVHVDRAVDATTGARALTPVIMR